MRNVTTTGTTNMDKATLRERIVEWRLLGWKPSNADAPRISKHAFPHWGFSAEFTYPSGDDGRLLLSRDFAYCLRDVGRLVVFIPRLL